MISWIWYFNVIVGWFDGIPIRPNAFSVANLIAAIGFSVEFCVHIVLKYKRQGGSKEMRVEKALNEMGTAVFVGIFCTKFIGIIFYAFAPSPMIVVYYFRMLFIMILCCAFYGLMVTPV